MQEKFKNYGLWVALFALLGMVLMDSVSNFNLGRYQEYVDMILYILIAAGVVSNPTAGKWFADNQNKGEDK
ncbi:hypothetical protein COO08_05360 [Bacillus toyonensis]|uniref:hypothetical protein n=1 Tax=Bacillus toyonensis TaxID=155322 RepID=UPI000BEC71C2|nr:hypothetical protein [Bacillus toyonensis]PEB19739.1 hypothetical protein COO08_05360 [Bacillus toyonensis]